MSLHREHLGKMMLRKLNPDRVVIERFSAGDVLYKPGEYSQSVFIVVEGGVKVSILEGENTAGFNLACRWSVIGLSPMLANDIHRCTAIVLVDSKIARVGASDALDFLKNESEALLMSLDALGDDYVECDKVRKTSEASSLHAR